MLNKLKNLVRIYRHWVKYGWWCDHPDEWVLINDQGYYECESCGVCTR